MQSAAHSRSPAPPPPLTPEADPSVAAGRVSLAIAGVLFVVYPALRPYSDETSPAGAVAFASPAWVASHLAAIVGFVLVALGMLGLRSLLAGGPGARTAWTAFLTFWVGTGLVLPYYGAETFALNAVGERAVQGVQPDVVAVSDAIRNGTVQVSLFGVGLLLLAVAAVLAAVAIWRAAGRRAVAGESLGTDVPSGTGLSRWTGLPLALGFVLFLPQFFGPPWLRIAHGVLLGAACVLLSVTMRPARRA
jgi:hypothetical protein